MNEIAVFSDVHGNRPALEELIHQLEVNDIKTSIFLGDLIGYIPDSSVPDLLSSIKSLKFCILGNHEMAYFENSVNQKNHDYHHEQNLSNTSASTIENMKNWPLSLSIELSSKKCLFVHGTREEPTIGYCYPDSKIMESDYDFVFMGNTHRPFIRAAGRTTYVNVGSIGLPRDDGRYASFCIFDPEDGSVKILRYSIENSNMDLLKKYPEISIEVREVFNRREKFFRSETGPN